ncbi:MAG: hypothetical protein JWO58_3396 [Chitinophagaceae bacterium]|nr:hypothetical protein [Chitinophagaceae bacterium]
MKDFVHNLKQKPEHVRKRIVLATTSAVTGLVAIAWIGTMAATGAFALSNGPGGTNATDGTLADASNPQATPAAQNVQSNFSQLVGAVGAAAGVATTSAPTIRVVDGTASSTLDRQAVPSTNSATVLPF